MILTNPIPDGMSLLDIGADSYIAMLHFRDAPNIALGFFSVHDPVINGWRMEHERMDNNEDHYDTRHVKGKSSNE